jgi:hypothetical protein
MRGNEIIIQHPKNNLASNKIHTLYYILVKHIVMKYLQIIEDSAHNCKCNSMETIEEYSEMRTIDLLQGNVRTLSLWWLTAEYEIWLSLLWHQDCFSKDDIGKFIRGPLWPPVPIAQSTGLKDLWTKMIRLPCEFLMTGVKYMQENGPINLNHQIQILNGQLSFWETAGMREKTLKTERSPIETEIFVSDRFEFCSNWWNFLAIVSRRLDLVFPQISRLSTIIIRNNSNTGSTYCVE